MRFFMIDRITQMEVGRKATAVKNVALSDDVFADHFPGKPIMPGTLMIEGMAQLAGILLEETVRATSPRRLKALLAIVERAKFRDPVYPGDQLVYRAELQSVNESGGRLSARAMVGDKLCAECHLVFCFAEFPSQRLEAKQQEIMAIWTRGLPERSAPSGGLPVDTASNDRR